ncbi:TetR family transcriptional regulator [Virgisporangium aliadipatigenens]|uniref:TetR family transcriptional regulator n=1 Tax=Virgisporangium aliadipatigenens TaxID=741659 RepID=A0A8J3YJL4_9ACTN|nr:TetR/AcrR family transcriptional regulator [Virgisporangium aliadipatigenens]GIJ45165.1 TetR family transcriptional regulator [Virgisporangium aliadipatigenens]
MPEPRRRDAAATREALLGAARDLISRHGVEGTSTRDIATAAGVNQTLVYRYFGSKEKLITEAIDNSGTTGEKIIAETPLDELPRALLEHILDASAARRTNSYSALLSSTNDDTLRELVRGKLEKAFTVGLAARLAGPDAALRAELVIALLSGIALLRDKLGTKAISAAGREEIAAHVERMCAPLLRG